ncbi:MAG: hypothetical protein ABIN61_07695 [candidate division WOR-3 bacterium]
MPVEVSFPVPVAYFFLVLFLSFMSASIKQSKVIDFFGEKILGEKNSRKAILMLIALSYLLSPFFLSFVLITYFRNWILRFEEKAKTLTLLILSTLIGSIITPFGNLQNVFIVLAFGNGKPGISISSFVSIMLPLWVSGFFALVLISYFISKGEEIKNIRKSVKIRKKELVFSIILFLFILGYFNIGRQYNFNLLGLIIIGGIFSLVFMGMETLKAVNWELLIPVGISFVFYYLFKYLPIGIFNVNPFIIYSIGVLGASGFSSNVLAFILPFLSRNVSFILYSISVGSIASVFGCYELILLFIRTKEEKINKVLLFGVFMVFLVISILLLFGRR